MATQDLKKKELNHCNAEFDITIMAESGRSMVEMLGTLAIMGVLSITSGMGIKYLLDKNMANRIMKDAHLGYVSTPVGSCVNEFISVDFDPSSGKQTDFYCDPKNEKYIRVSGISDAVCDHLLKMEQDNEVELYAYDEYTRPLCDKGDNALIFAFADTGFPAIACESVADCPPDFYGICHKTDKVCLECPLTQKPNETADMCIDVTCDEVTETLCETDKAKWCCPNTELCGTTAGVCIKSDGMCSAIFTEPTVTKTYDCAYKFNEPVVTKTYDCAYKMVAHTRSDGLETIDLQEVKACANSALYCNLTYADESCGKTADAGTPIGTTLYGTCAPMNTSYSGCTSVIDNTNVLQEVKACANSSLYCNLQYADESCGKTADAGTPSGTTLYGTCAPMNTSYSGCTSAIDSSTTLQEIKQCPSSQYCHLKYTDEQCTAASASAQDLLFGVCLPMNSSNAVCPVPSK